VRRQNASSFGILLEMIVAFPVSGPWMMKVQTVERFTGETKKGRGRTISLTAYPAPLARSGQHVYRASSDTAVALKAEQS